MSQRMTSFKGVCQPAVINSSLVLREAWKMSPTPSRLFFDVLPSGLYEENEKICFFFFFFLKKKGNNLLYVLFRTTVIKSSFRSLSTAGRELLFVVHQGHIGTGLIVFIICWRLCLRFLCRVSFQVTVYGGRSRMSA